MRKPARALAVTGAILAATLAVTVPPLAATPAAEAAKPTVAHTGAQTKSLPAPPPPAQVVPTARVLQAASTTTTAGTNGSGAPGANANQRTLILYDTTNSWGWLGEAYAAEAGNLASHGSAYTMHPVASYQAGELAGYTGVIYIGSTYDEPIPVAFLDDVLGGTKPVLWMADNIWQLTARAGDFATRYGWTWTQFDFATTATVTYKNVALQRSALAAPSGLLATTVTDPAKASVLATATRADGTTEPWAVRSGTLTYVAEIPFSYVGPLDRYFAAADLVGQIANPATPARKRALVRLEDVSPGDDPNELQQVVNYLSGQHIPFTIGVIPQYLDPNGYYDNGKPVSTSLAQAPALVKVLKDAQTKGGTVIMHGYTHQYANVANPYDGVTADDFEFYTAHVDASNAVVYDGPVPVDSAAWAQQRITAGKAGFTAAGLAVPTVFETPHYAASATDYSVFAQNFGTRYERGLYFAGWCPSGACGTGTPDYSKMYGQYFPYLVRDIYGSVVVPEDLGNVEPVPYNTNPARLPADILASAKAVGVVQDGVQSFFYHPYLGTSYLKQIVSGLKSMGYTFVPAGTVAAG